jgi:hypothetical protein
MHFNGLATTRRVFGTPMHKLEVVLLIDFVLRNPIQSLFASLRWCFGDLPSLMMQQ